MCRKESYYSLHKDKMKSLHVTFALLVSTHHIGHGELLDEI